MQREPGSLLFDQQALMLVSKRPGALQDFVRKLRLDDEDIIIPNP